ncbi:MAG: helix-turn-helix transcriptional regulator [Saprospiraceae bacterium]|nr:helix-turn-helix transcriptional regulator [Saprospiraceae bacterium]
MEFDFNLYSTPLLFGFVQAWIYALLFWVRGWRNERLSDWLLGFLLAAMSFEIWEYMLGFAGIDLLWNELEFFPRNFSLLLPPMAWFYLRSQFNADFRLQRRDLVHALPYLLYFVYHVAVFSMGRDFVENWKQNVHFRYGFENVQALLTLGMQIFYFYRSFRLYQDYRNWSPSEFSDVEAVSFKWFRNFLVAFIASSIIGWSMTLLDLWLNLDFWHDWWDELFNAGLIYYLCIAGYAQTQPRRLHFEPTSPTAEVVVEEAPILPKAEKLADEELQSWKAQIERLMADERLYLEPELTLSDLARRLQTNASLLSAAVNRAFGKNFNDFVNEYRVEEVKRLLEDPKAKHLSLLGIGLECGFNSKSTFNRAFRKVTGVAPSEWGKHN